MATSKAHKQWGAEAMDPPSLSQLEWNKAMVLGTIFVVMGLLQVASFNDFKDALTNMGLTSASTWAALLILIELWAAVGFFRLRLSKAFRMASTLFAVLASGFWFFETVRVVSADMTNLHSSAFFGRFLAQSPGWWTVIEATLVLFWTLWAVSVTQVKSK